MSDDVYADPGYSDPGYSDPATDGPATDDAAHPWRRWLRAYPRGWRDRHGEALIGTALDVADAEGRDRPTRREVADLVGHGLAARVGSVLPSPGVLQPAAVAAVVLGGTLALTALVLGELVPPYRPNQDFYVLLENRWGPFSTIGPALYLPWVAALAAVGLGRRRWVRALLAICAVVAVALVPIGAALELNRPPRAMLLALLWCALVGAAGLRDAPRAAAAGGVAGAVGLTAIVTVASGGPPALLPAGVGWATWADAYQTFPFYRGVAGEVGGGVLMVAFVIAVVGVATRRPQLVLALLLVAPGTLPWQVDEPGFRWGFQGLQTHDQIWRTVALALPLLVVAADRLRRHRTGVVSGIADHTRG